ncbi:putative phosphotransacetylase [Anaerobacterium chartisolvens]|uniref:Phosphate propanoyltransferase n=1 Tax=Anaerobacterium chartisolvens TaxID=1297424 RepID=A0A369B910_9FIRM|nr:putative phosphotransacetylase [Anaerobacterium chartisolvens]
MEQELLRQIVIKIIQKITAHSVTELHPKPFPIGVSNRHIHLSKEDLELLFGHGHSLKCRRELSQPGQCVSFETVMLAGPKGCIEQVKVLGPVRKQTQIEISRGDAFKLGVNAPIRESGNLKGSGGITVIGPMGSVHLKEGAIIAQRHIHMTPLDAESYGVKDGQKAQVKYTGERGVIFDNVIVRVSDKFALEFHIDIDEANGAGIKHGEMAYLLFSGLSVVPNICDPIKSESTQKAIIEEPVGLVTEDTVRRAWKKKAVITVNKGVICTPLARDAIKELGVEVIWN